ncbi:MAG TPA: hypothetical protein VFU43_10560 [Streptosporangiaceae bacterium]|nr:hypothetical protein [Streptosporangiaceae bacterium]
MNTTWGRGLLGAVTLGIATLLPAAPPAAPGAFAAVSNASATGYRAIDLGAGFHSSAVAINERGHVAVVSGNRSVLWRDGKIIDLGVLSESLSSVVTDLNDRDEVVGFGTDADIARPFLWRNGRLTALEVLPGGDSTVAFGINNAGQVVGSGTTTARDGPHALIWQAGRPIDLDPSGTWSLARDITNNGWIIGESGGQATVWRRGVPTVLYSGTARAMNERHQVVGYASGSLLWSRGEVTDLGAPEGATAFEAQDVNNRSQVVGNSTIGAVLWQRGAFVKLPLPPGGLPTGSAAFAINDRGQIVGSADILTAEGQETHAVLWTR